MSDYIVGHTSPVFISWRRCGTKRHLDSGDAHLALSDERHGEIVSSAQIYQSELSRVNWKYTACSLATMGFSNDRPPHTPPALDLRLLAILSLPVLVTLLDTLVNELE